VTRLLFLLFLFLVASCAVAPQRVPIEWPSDIRHIEGEGDIDMAWRKEKHSGSFALRVDYPNLLALEVYGPFGQTAVSLTKEGDRFLFIAGDQKTTDERPFEHAYGFTVRQLMDDLVMKGARQQTAEGTIIEHEDYRVVFGEDRKGRRKVCWEGREGTICLTFQEIDFAGP
jgi:hypothetical protein